MTEVKKDAHEEPAKSVDARLKLYNTYPAESARGKLVRLLLKMRGYDPHHAHGHDEHHEKPAEANKNKKEESKTADNQEKEPGKDGKD